MTTLTTTIIIAVMTEAIKAQVPFQDYSKDPMTKTIVVMKKVTAT